VFSRTSGNSAEEKRENSAAGRHAAPVLEEAGLWLRERVAVLLGPRHPQLHQLNRLLSRQLQLLQARCDHLPLIRSCFASWVTCAARRFQGSRRTSDFSAPVMPSSRLSSVTLLLRCLYRWREAWLLKRDRRVSLQEEERRTRRLMAKEAILRKRIGLWLGEGRGCCDMSSLAWASLHLWVRGVAAQRLEAATSEHASASKSLARAHSESCMWQQRAEASLASGVRIRNWRHQAASNTARRLFKVRSDSHLRQSLFAWQRAALEIRQHRQQQLAPFAFEVAASSGFANAALLQQCLHAWQGASAFGTECTISDVEEERTLLEAHLASSQRCLRVLEAWARGLEDSLLRVSFRAWSCQLSSIKTKQATGLKHIFYAWARHLSVSRSSRELKVRTSWLLFRRREAGRVVVFMTAWHAEAQAARRDRALAGSGRRGAARRGRRQLVWAEGCRGRGLKRLAWASWRLLGRITKESACKAACVRSSRDTLVATCWSAWALAVRRSLQDNPEQALACKAWDSSEAAVTARRGKGSLFEQSVVKDLLQQRTARPLLIGLR